MLYPDSTLSVIDDNLRVVREEIETHKRAIAIAETELVGLKKLREELVTETVTAANRKPQNYE
jgi:hypothetical protein